MPETVDTIDSVIDSLNFDYPQANHGIDSVIDELDADYTARPQTSRSHTLGLPWTEGPDPLSLAAERAVPTSIWAIEAAMDKKKEPGLLRDIANAYRQGALTLEKERMWRQALHGKIPPSQARQFGREVLLRMEAFPSGKDAWYLNIPRTTVRMLPPIVGGLIRGKTTGYLTGLTFAAGTAALGQAGPQILAPEEVVTVPAAAATGFAVGSTYGALKYWHELGEGIFFREAIEAGVPANVAGPVAQILAVPYALVEYSQVGKLKPFRQIIKQPFTKALKALGRRYVVDLAENVAQEGVQRVIEEMQVDIGKVLADMEVEDERLAHYVNSALEEMKAAVGPMALLLLPGATVDAGNVMTEKMSAAAMADKYNTDKETVLAAVDALRSQAGKPAVTPTPVPAEAAPAQTKAEERELAKRKRIMEKIREKAIDYQATQAQLNAGEITLRQAAFRTGQDIQTREQFDLAVERAVLQADKAEAAPEAAPAEAVPEEGEAPPETPEVKLASETIGEAAVAEEKPPWDMTEQELAEWVSPTEVPSEPVVPGPEVETSDPITGVDLTSLTNTGPQVRTTLSNLNRIFTTFTSLDSDVRRALVEFREQIAYLPQKAAEHVRELFRGLTSPERRAIQLSDDNPGKYPASDLPAHLRLIAEQVIADNADALATHQQMGHLTEGGWPGGRIQQEQRDIAKLQKERAKEVAENSPAELIAEIDDEIQRRRDVIEELETLGYVHRITRQPGLATRIYNRVIGRQRSRKITQRPPTLYKQRRFFTIEEAEEAGFEVADLAVSHADMLAQTWVAKANHNLIEAINKNPDLSLPADEAPADWVRIHRDMMPAAQGRAYSPPIADAIKELTWTGDTNVLWRKYDKINFAMKIINFYKATIMAKNDLFQGWRAGGLKFFYRIPRAIKIWLEQGEMYHALRKGGLFNRVFSHDPAAAELIQDILDEVELSQGKKIAKWLKRYLNPLKPIESLNRLNTKTTWNMDEVLRVAAWDAIHDGRFAKEFGMTEFELVELTNDFMANYGKVPRATRQILNRFFFTPTYRISMKRMLGNMFRQPKKFWPQLLRHYGYKLFVWYIMPKLVGLMVAGRSKDAYPERGYRIVVRDPKNPGREIVFSLSDPLLEEAKMLGQPLPDYVLYQLSAGINAIIAFTRGPKFAGSTDPFGGIFKLGTPFWSDLELMASEDRSSAEKIIQALGLAYVYTRRKKKGDEKNALEQFGIAISFWADWKEQKGALERSAPIIAFEKWWDKFQKKRKGGTR